MGQEQIGKPALEMNKNEKIEFIRFLDQKGAFLITKSGNRSVNFWESANLPFIIALKRPAASRIRLTATRPERDRRETGL